MVGDQQHPAWYGVVIAVAVIASLLGTVGIGALLHIVWIDYRDYAREKRRAADLEAAHEKAEQGASDACEGSQVAAAAPTASVDSAQAAGRARDGQHEGGQHAKAAAGDSPPYTEVARESELELPARPPPTYDARDAERETERQELRRLPWPDVRYGRGPGRLQPASVSQLTLFSASSGLDSDDDSGDERGPIRRFFGGRKRREEVRTEGHTGWPYGYGAW